MTEELVWNNLVKGEEKQKQGTRTYHVNFTIYFVDAPFALILNHFFYHCWLDGILLISPNEFRSDRRIGSGFENCSGAFRVSIDFAPGHEAFLLAEFDVFPPRDQFFRVFEAARADV